MPLHNVHMDMELLYNARRERLRSYMRLECNGRQVELAEELGKSPATVSRFFNEKNRKRIGEELAREIEEKLKKPRYWLDGVELDKGSDQWPFLSIAISELRGLTGEQLASIETVMRTVLDVATPKEAPELKKLKRRA